MKLLPITDYLARIDLSRLWKAIQNVGYTQSTLAEQIGCEQSTISRFLSGKSSDASFRLFTTICKIIGVPEYAFRLDLKQGVTYIRETDDGLRGEILDNLIAGKLLVSFSRYMDSYLLPTPVAEQVKIEQLQQYGYDRNEFDRRLSLFQQFAEVRYRNRWENDHKMLLIGGYDRLTDYLKINLDEYELERRLIQEHGSTTVPVFLTSAKALELHNLICHYLKVDMIDKINIRDDLRMVFWVRGDMLDTYDPKRVPDVLAIIQQFVQNRCNVGYEIPQMSTMVRPRIVRSASRDALYYLDSLVRRQGDVGISRDSDAVTEIFPERYRRD